MAAADTTRSSPRWARILVRAPFLAWLALVWAALWGDVSAANVLSGVVVGSLLLVLFPSAGPGAFTVARPLRAGRFLAYFVFKLVEANFVVAWEVITPNNDSVSEGIVAVPITGASDAVVTLVANAISLTPGTVTLDVRRSPATLYVHVLHLRSIESTRREVQKLERLALEAFGSLQAIENARVLREGNGVVREGGRVVPSGGPVLGRDLPPSTDPADEDDPAQPHEE